MAHLGLSKGSSNTDTNESESGPKTSARLRGNTRETASFAAKRKGKSQHEDVAITLTDAMVEGRMKLPARMFTKGNKCVIDGHTFTQQPADQHRSTKFNPEILINDPEVGDTLVFSHVQGREWTVSDVTEGQRPSRKAKSTPVAKKQAREERPAKSKTSKPSTSGSAKLRRSDENGSNIKAKIKDFAAMCIENGNDDDFEENENIKQSGTFDVDARVYFTTAQNQKFRSWRKSQGLTLKKAVGMLNTEVFE